MPFDATRPELIIDLFAGGGGVSTGFEMGLGRSPDYAVNHRAEALAMHRANHPNTRHVTEDVWHFDPRAVIGDWPVGILWASPDCKHFSRAKGAIPVDKNIRDLAWVVVKLAREISPRIIMVENVPEFLDWGPLIEDDQGRCYPDPARKGDEFLRWQSALKALGYRVEWRKLRAYQHGIPTLRTRLFVIARRDGRPIVWPEITHDRPGAPAVMAGRAKPWRTAAEIIDWNIPCYSIFDSSAEIWDRYGVRIRRPLAEATMARIAHGVWRWVLTDPDPFILTLTHGGRLEPIREPLRTLTSAHRGERALVMPSLAASMIDTGNGERSGQGPRAYGVDRPLRTITASGAKSALIAAHLSPQYGTSRGASARAPVGAITSDGMGKQAVIAAFLAQHNAGGYSGPGRSARAPLSTLTAAGSQQGVVTTSMSEGRAGHAEHVRAFLTKYYSAGQIAQSLRDPLHTVTEKARMGLVTVHGVDLQITDICMRMLVPCECYRAHAFPADYIVDHGIDEDGRKIPLSKTLQYDFVGNSVPPEFVAQLSRLNAPELARGGMAA